MGQLYYDSSHAVGIDDRALAHLQTVVIDKLRRAESFAWTFEDGERELTVWVSSATPLQFVYAGNRRPVLNRAWLESLALVASSTDGLRLVPEPDEATVVA